MNFVLEDEYVYAVLGGWRYRPTTVNRQRLVDSNLPPSYYSIFVYGGV
jgi:hypothetical protein